MIKITAMITPTTAPLLRPDDFPDFDGGAGVVSIMTIWNQSRAVFSLFALTFLFSKLLVIKDSNKFLFILTSSCLIILLNPLSANVALI